MITRTELENFEGVRERVSLQLSVKCTDAAPREWGVRKLACREV
jgi:hypothetical protein